MRLAIRICQAQVPLFWCFVMLTFVIYIFALVFVRRGAGARRQAPGGSQWALTNDNASSDTVD